MTTRTVDITSLLKSSLYSSQEKPKSDKQILQHCDFICKFNPSICHIRDDYYFLSYRYFAPHEMHDNREFYHALFFGRQVEYWFMKMKKVRNELKAILTKQDSSDDTSAHVSYVDFSTIRFLIDSLLEQNSWRDALIEYRKAKLGNKFIPPAFEDPRVVEQNISHESDDSWDLNITDSTSSCSCHDDCSQPIMKLDPLIEEFMRGLLVWYKKSWLPFLSQVPVKYWAPLLIKNRDDLGYALNSSVWFDFQDVLLSQRKELQSHVFETKNAYDTNHYHHTAIHDKSCYYYWLLHRHPSSQALHSNKIKSILFSKTVFPTKAEARKIRNDIKNTYDVFHPYKNRWSATFGGTGFALLKMEMKDPQKVKVIQEWLYEEYQVVDGQAPIRFPFVDIRLFEATKQETGWSIFGYYTSLYRGVAMFRLQLHIPEIGTIRRSQAKIYIDPKFDVIGKQNWTNKPRGLGKNWSLFVVDSKYRFTIQLCPPKVVEAKTSTMDDVKLQEVQLPYPVSSFFCFTHDQHIFSLGTPARPLQDQNGVYLGEYIAAGHSKWPFLIGKDKRKKFPYWTNSIKICQTEEYLLHYKDQYLIYFYTFDPETYELKRISYSFLIPTFAPYRLQFPVGLIFKDPFWILTYGEGDVRCKIAMFSISEILDLLHPVKDVLTQPQNYKC